MLYFFILFDLCFLLAVCGHSDGEISVGFMVLVIVSWMIAGVASHFNHVEDLATIETQQQIVTIQSDKIERLSSVLTALESNNTALLNADTPMAKLIEELALAEKDFADAKVYLVKAKKNIIARERSLFKFIT